MNHPAHIAIIGATSGIATACASLWASQPRIHLSLVGRNSAALERLATHLRIAHPAASFSVHVHELRLPRQVAAMVHDISANGVPGVALIAHGLLPDQPACQRDLEALDEALQVNAVSPALCCEALALAMQDTGGTIGLIGSVAGDRGRQSNYAYGAAKGLLDRYAQGLQHRFAPQGRLHVCLIKPGPTETAMTAHLKGHGPAMASVDQVARDIVNGMARGQPVIYTPGKWRLIMMVIRHLPRFVFNKMRI